MRTYLLSSLPLSEVYAFSSHGVVTQANGKKDTDRSAGVPKIPESDETASFERSSRQCRGANCLRRDQWINAFGR